MPESVIVKVTNPQGPSDMREALREPTFYRTIYPDLPIPKPEILYLGHDEKSGWNLLVMEDLSFTHRIPQHPYQWTPAELRPVLQSYALLHSASLLPAEGERQWLNPRHEAQLDFEAIPVQAAIIQKAGIWRSIPRLPDLIDCARTSLLKYESTNVCLLHNDTTPTNAPLPKHLESMPAILIDWQDAGVGMAEMDLAYLDLQPFGSARAIPRAELLALYWNFREGIEGQIPSSKERRERQLHADLVMALWLIRPGSRDALQPYPAGSYPRMHWDSQFKIVYDRLVSLSAEILP
jgi:hypothetical protein